MVNFYTHAGRFHCDEVAAFVIAEQAGVVDNLVRLQDIKNIPNDGIIADIGREYNPKQLKFDHHQGYLIRENGYPLATAGLMWKQYGADFIKRVLPSLDSMGLDYIHNYVDKYLIQGFDAHDADNDYSVNAMCVSGPVKVLTLPEIIRGMNHKNVNDHKEQEGRFFYAKVFIDSILTRYVLKGLDRCLAATEIEFIASDSPILVLTDKLEWFGVIHEVAPHVRYVIAPSQHPGSSYSLTAVTVSEGSRKVHVPIERLGGFEGFIHQGKWVAGGKSIEELRTLAELNLKANSK